VQLIKEIFGDDDTNINVSFKVKLREMKLLSRKNENLLIDSICESMICKNPFFANSDFNRFITILRYNTKEPQLAVD
jgi:hypothetical protein